jgi:ribonuclease HI
MDYASAAWQPFLSESILEKLEVAQNKCLRLITGHYTNTNLDAIHLETGIPTYHTHSKQLTAIAYEKGMRMDSTHPRRAALDKDLNHRLKSRSSLRVQGKDIVSTLPIKDSTRRPIPSPIIQPQPTARTNWKISTNVSIKHDINAVKAAIDALEADYVVYTDGSCSGGTSKGGAAAVVTSGSTRDLCRVATCQAKGDRLTSSYSEEERALSLGIEWASNHPQERVAFCTDSLSLLLAIQSRNPKTDPIRRQIESLSAEVELMYVPGHKDILGNELADAYAKKAARQVGPFARDDDSMEAARSEIR